MGTTPELLNTLEDLMVQEFRACQYLHSLTKDERQALSNQDVTCLPGIVEEKEVLLDQLSRIEDQRRMVVQDLASRTGLCGDTITLVDVLKTLHGPEPDRIGRVREGIMALAISIREMTSGNRALANAAMERVDSVQAFLLNLYQPAASYQPPGVSPRPAPAVAGEIDHRF